ncbi:MAG: hypothetical protein IJW40_10145 [Clostridia bacterium]|nr:hypothetical protein [Clostridia bacterium]
MGRFFQSKQQNQELSGLQLQTNHYQSARYHLLLVVIFTLINLVLLALGSSSYFLFSATIPYAITGVAKWMSPEETYLTQPLFLIALIISLALVALYLVGYFLSKHFRGGWLIFSLVFFMIDSIGLFIFFGISVDMLMDIIIHVWVIISLSRGVIAYGKIKQQDPVEAFPLDALLTPLQPEGAAEGQTVPPLDLPDSAILRRANGEVNARILLELQACDHRIAYRRVGKVNELIIDGYVYAEHTALWERAHRLSANVGGHTFTVGYDGASFCYATVDDLLAMRKLRTI